jgi:hypothetical protein
MPERFKKLNKIQSFHLFCLESYRSAKQISGKKALNDFKRANVFSFLSEYYDLLHTQSQNYIVSEINRYIKRNNATLPREH